MDTLSPLEKAVSKLQSSPRRAGATAAAAAATGATATSVAAGHAAASNVSIPVPTVQKPSNQSNFEYMPVFFKKLHLVDAQAQN